MTLSHSDRLLSSWKEIATCLNRGVRTVQRWETQGLPVLRPAGPDSNVVMAVESEIREWMRNHLEKGVQDSSESEPVREAMARLEALKDLTVQLSARLQELRNRLEVIRGVESFGSTQDPTERDAIARPQQIPAPASSVELKRAG